MSDKVFLDTNILIYCYTTSEPEKQAKALAVANLPTAIISTQVLKEFANVLYKKFTQDWATIQDVLEELESNFEIHINTSQSIKNACAIADRYGYSFYDSLIIAAAIESGASVLYSEDMHHEHLVDKVLTIRNPLLEE